MLPGNPSKLASGSKRPWRKRERRKESIGDSSPRTGSDHTKVLGPSQHHAGFGTITPSKAPSSNGRRFAISLVLMAQDHRGVPNYGRPDLSEFMANVPVECVPWAEYSVS